MRSKKLLSLLAAATMAVSAFAGLMVTSNAAVSQGFELVYNKEASSATTRVVEVYMKNVDNFWVSELKIDCPSQITKASCSYAITQDANGDNMTNANLLTGGVFTLSMVAPDYVEVGTDSSLKMATLTFTVANGTEDFNIQVSDKSFITDMDENNIAMDFAETKITLADPTAAPPTEEPTEEPTVEPTEEPVVKTGDNAKEINEIAAPDDVDAGFVDEASLWQETVEANGTTYTKVKVVATNMSDETAEGSADLGTEITGAINVFIAINTAKDNIKSLVVSFE